MEPADPGDGQAPLRRQAPARGPGRLARRPRRRDRRLAASSRRLDGPSAVRSVRVCWRCWRAIASTITASSRTPPVTMNLTAEESASRSIPLEIEPITRAPSSAVQTEPRPPKRLVPAITGPAIASSRSSLPPEFWLTASRREAAMMPPIAAIVPAMPKTAIRTRLTLIPERRAASALPPTAKTWRPKPVRLTTYSMPITKASRISTASGTPRSELRTATATITTAESRTKRTACSGGARRRRGRRRPGGGGRGRGRHRRRRSRPIGDRSSRRCRSRRCWRAR